MITFYQCLTEYKKRKDAIDFSKNRLKKISSYCKYVYDSGPGSTVTYTESREGEETFTVRSYPNYFKKFIMSVILKAHNK